MILESVSAKMKFLTWTMKCKKAHYIYLWSTSTPEMLWSAILGRISHTLGYRWQNYLKSNRISWNKVISWKTKQSYLKIDIVDITKWSKPRLMALVCTYIFSSFKKVRKVKIGSYKHPKKISFSSIITMIKHFEPSRLGSRTRLSLSIFGSCMSQLSRASMGKARLIPWQSKSNNTMYALYFPFNNPHWYNITLSYWQCVVLISW